MWKCFWAAAAALLLAAAPARAQTTKPDVASEAAAAASAAMERAKRQAAGPMRVILEASKSRRKIGDADGTAPVPSTASSPAALPTDSGSVRTVASRSLATGSPEPITRSMAGLASAPVPPPVVLSVAGALTAPVTAPAVAAPSGVVTQLTLTSETLQGKIEAAQVPGLELSGAVSATPAPPAAATLATVPKMAAAPNTLGSLAKVRLINRVDPTLAQRQLDDMGRNALVTVDLTIRADGTVRSVAMVPPTPRGIQRALLEALEQWRFEPLPEERVHRMQLIFNPEP